MHNLTPDLISIKMMVESDTGDEFCNIRYRDLIAHNLQKILPGFFFTFSPEKNLAVKKDYLKKNIPILTYTEINTEPTKISFYALSKFRVNSFKFFFEMISCWLIPGKRLAVELVYSADFQMVDLSEDVFTYYEVGIKVFDPAELEDIKRNFLLIYEEIVLGIQSEYYAQRLLEIKGLSFDDKTSLVQQKMTSLLKRFASLFDITLCVEMQNLLITCRDDFKAGRQVLHLCRMITGQYLLRKKIRGLLNKSPKKCHLLFKAFKCTYSNYEKTNNYSLAILMCVNLLREAEAVGLNFLVDSIRNFLPNSVLVDNSSYIQKHSTESVCMAYLEVEKEDKAPFSAAEIKKLKQQLPQFIKNNLSQQFHHIFMHRNEEEILKNMLTLSKQIRYVRDIPQIVVSFDEQLKKQLSFTIIISRVLKKNCLPLHAFLKANNYNLEYQLDRCKNLGFLRNKYPKEASVLHVQIDKEKFIRPDHSIDLYKARQTVVNWISSIVGEVRDYNGGMLSKQHELLNKISQKLSDELHTYDDLLLESFFYGLSPVSRALVDPIAFSKLFTELVIGLKKYAQEPYYLSISDDGHHSYAMIISSQLSFKQPLENLAKELRQACTKFNPSYIKAYGNFCTGVICTAKNRQTREQFLTKVQNYLKKI